MLGLNTLFENNWSDSIFKGVNFGIIALLAMLICVFIFGGDIHVSFGRNTPIIWIFILLLYAILGLVLRNWARTFLIRYRLQVVDSRDPYWRRAIHDCGMYFFLTQVVLVISIVFGILPFAAVVVAGHG